MPLLNWNIEQSTSQILSNIQFINLSDETFQFEGKNFSPNNWTHRIDNVNFFSHLGIIDTVSSPQNIIKCFQNNFLLEGLALVVSWGTMYRQNNQIYNQDKEIIKKCLKFAIQNIHETNSIEESWNKFIDILEWKDVITSKVLHFLTRSLNFSNPPVPIDYQVIKNNLWKNLRIFLNNNNITSIAKWFDRNNNFALYNNYMSAILTWADIYECSTSELETRIYNTILPKIKFNIVNNR